ncbi:NAD-dependent protein deacetylase sirtuin-2-like [Actinia tenebrosa]|uniref:NAD-dependent protein deacetylase sirtuin-2-like n=1 Tax=Actinia tenebrosa TaxID=6105 RepID=A0A6P8J0R2_ACTTE|nr:NAD-dependent protein deacetylase sirtuin-2-like [Actinia tenebrosa]
MKNIDNDGASSKSGSQASQGTGTTEENKHLNFLQQLLARFRVAAPEEEEKEKPEQLLEEVTFEGAAKYIKSEKCKNIIVMTGAGISTAAGIPDFRSPGTGLYDNLQKYNLPSPQSVFEIGYFRENPEPFYMLAKELYPGTFKPTISHYFIKLLENKGVLLRNYTQNIDTLERIAGLSSENIVEAHGTFHSAHCIECRKEYTQEWVKDKVFKDKIPKCSACEGIVKPDIVFFGESLPKRFFNLVDNDLHKCDMLIVMGTSLVVQPFASLIDRVPLTTPRLLINREKAANRGDMWGILMGTGGFAFDEEHNYRDVAWLGDTDDGCVALADLLGWKDELLSMVKTVHQKIDEEIALHSDTPETKQPTASSETSTGTNQTQVAKDSPSSPEKTDQGVEETKDDLDKNTDPETQEGQTTDEQTEDAKEGGENPGKSNVTDTVSIRETSATSPTGDEDPCLDNPEP